MEYMNNTTLAETGRKRVDWAHSFMPVLHKVEKRFEEDKPFHDISICACLHVTIETANLLLSLKAGGANLTLCSCSNETFQEDVAATLVKDYGIQVFATKNEDAQTHYRHIMNALDTRPNITIDDGAELISMIHTEREDCLDSYYGGIEETRGGILRIQKLADTGILKKPVIDINESNTKKMFDNCYGTGQGSIHALLQASNILLSGKNFVISGYGWCGKGIASYAKALGAHVFVTEVNPVRALEAAMDGFHVCKMDDAIKEGDIFCTATGNINILRKEHFAAMKHNAIVFNSGFDCEIKITDLACLAKNSHRINQYIESFVMDDGKKINLLCNGKVANLSVISGHASAVMDVSFANQALAAEFIAERYEVLDPKIYPIPNYIDESVAVATLEKMHISIDECTREQKEFMRTEE